VRRSRRIGSGWCKREGGTVSLYSRGLERRRHQAGRFDGRKSNLYSRLYLFTIANANTTRDNTHPCWKGNPGLRHFDRVKKKQIQNFNQRKKKGRSSFSSFTLALTTICYTTTTKERLMKGN
jgi:hypothetical protein